MQPVYFILMSGTTSERTKTENGQVFGPTEGEERAGTTKGNTDETAKDQPIGRGQPQDNAFVTNVKETANIICTLRINAG